METFKRKSLKVEAIKWDAEMETWNDIQRLAGKTEPGEPGKYNFYIITLDGRIEVQKGNWLVRDEIGQLHSYKPVDFEYLYEKF